MNAVQRRVEIYQILQQSTTIEIHDLAERLDVSAMTIRRDLALFEKQGIFVKTYGGGYVNKGVGIEPSFAVKQGQMLTEKRYIASAASKLVNEGDSVVLDCGTTPLQLVSYLSSKRITLITNSWPVINQIQANSKMKVILAPGEYSQISAGALSGMTAEFYRNIHADIAFISTQGFCIKYGATVPDNEDAVVKQSILENAKTKVLLLDHTKIGSRYLARYGAPCDFDIIITDDQVNEKQVEDLKTICENVIIADSKSFEQIISKDKVEDDI